MDTSVVKSWFEDMPLTLGPGWWASLALWLLGLLFMAAAFRSLLRARPLGLLVHTLTGLVLLMSGVAISLIGLGVHGYRALTHEQVAAHIRIEPLGAQHFRAHFTLPDGSRKAFELRGDALYVDAHVLKWKPVANLLGLHTAYELDRVSGRYVSLDQERTAERTVHSLRLDRPVDLFTLRERFGWLSGLLDTDYGSASFKAVNGASEMELRVSTTGLLLRAVPPGTPPSAD